MRLDQPTDPRGAGFIRAAIALAVCKGKRDEAAGYAEARWGPISSAVTVLRGAIAAGSTLPGEWGAELTAYLGQTIAIFGAVKALTVLDRLIGIRQVPLQVPCITATGKLTATFVEPGAAVPVGKLSFARDTLEAKKVGAIAVETNELLRTPEAEQILRVDLTRALGEAVDLAFLDPGNGGDAATPASITNGVIADSFGAGTTTEEIAAFIGAFTGDLRTAFFIGRPALFAALCSPEFPSIGVRGGEIAGVPAIPASQLPLDAGSLNQLVLVDAAGIALAEGTAEIDVSTAGSIEMTDSPTGDSVAPTATRLVSLMQTGSTGFLGTLTMNWSVARPGSVAILDGLPNPQPAPAS